MPYYTALPIALKRFGLDVEVVPGYQTAGSESFNPRASVGHHTAGPESGDRPSLRVCVEGRPKLPGPLCNTFLPRGLTPAQRKVIVVACGRANHAGLGGFRGLVGNSSVLGTEMEDDGLDGLWTPWQMWAMPRVQAAQLWLIGQDASWYCSHRTWAPTRKIDPTGIGDEWMRDRIAALLAAPTSPPKESKPMDILCNDANGTVWHISGNTRLRVRDRYVAQLLEKAGAYQAGEEASNFIGSFPIVQDPAAIRDQILAGVREAQAAHPVTAGGPTAEQIADVIAVRLAT